MNPNFSRRHFLKQGSLVSAALAASPQLFAQVAGSAPEIKVALVGCGGRGNGALNDFLEACKILKLSPKVVATADAFPENAKRTAEAHGVPADQVFSGYDAYQKAFKTDCNFVLLATPPAFRPVHFAAAVAAGKNVFMEKPVAVDPGGCRSVIETGKLAASKGLGVVAGTQRRHQLGYLVNKAKIDAGAIGPIRGGLIQWNDRVPWIRDREEGWSDTEYLTRNWLNFVELSGDHIVEQHVHQIDVACWFLGRLPVSALGFGGRARRRTGNQFDFFSIDFDFGDEVHIHSQCRQMSGVYNRVGETFTGATGSCYGGGKMAGTEVTIPEIKVDTENSMVQEHVDLLRSVLEEKPLNDAQRIAEVTAVAIMGRISAYTGQMVRWVDIMKNEKSPFFGLSMNPAAADFEKGPITLPAEAPPIPGDA
ncbi:putative dehydrogenase [Haloferula luteola]|uniref:Putative dehydrogenase n=1 Tax=Haloferula luteola TaxID=595692 RepID=A0A840V3J2_9BACT|nr:Gfo/Idh/MocA family oxidoreductase [Haloferula luteola]MBB5352565.1 putative dehydrogenase [Haloferula luteola]